MYPVWSEGVEDFDFVGLGAWRSFRVALFAIFLLYLGRKRKRKKEKGAGLDGGSKGGFDP